MRTPHHRHGLYAPELLEARIAPATFTVTTLADAGAGSLRAAIDGIAGVGGANDAPGADVVIFDPAILPGTILLTTGEIDIIDTLTINGPGADLLTVSGSNASRIFHIDDNDTTVLHPTKISGLTLLDGNAAGAGGALYSTESLSLKNVVINSSVSTAGFGGGVAVKTPGTVSFDHVQVLANSAPGPGGGALLEADAGVSVIASLFAQNSGANFGGGLQAKASNAFATIVVDGTSFISNTSTGAGGGLALQPHPTGTMTLKNSVFTGNTASQNGGGLYGYLGKLTIKNTSFAGNSATGNGGAISEFYGDSLKISNSSFDRNTASGNGGALDLKDAHAVTITGSLFTGNASTLSGGAIHATSAGSIVFTALTVSGSTFAGNAATTDGGAFSLTGPGTSLTLSASTVSGNTAVDGGGIVAAAGAKVTVVGGVFSGNTTSDDGGGIHTRGTGTSAVNLSVTGTLFQGNRAMGGSSSGGGIHTEGDGIVFLKSARVIGNLAGEDGGGLDLHSTTSITIKNGLLQHNLAANDGGGLAIDLASGAAVGKITGSKFLDNFATGDDGGGIHISGNALAVLTINFSVVSGNVAADEGGGIRKGLPTLNLLGVLVSGNWAPFGKNIFP